MDQFEELMASILMCEPEHLPPDPTPLRGIKGWDSLKHVLLVVGLEQRLKTKLSAEEIKRMITLADVRDTMRQKGSNA